jgi:tripartite ATP-independent transporter DctM subunit
MFKLLGALLAGLGVAAMPLFALLGGISILAWLASEDPNQRVLRRVVANVLDEKFANSDILVTVPLFVFVGYLMAESKTPTRIVRAANSVLGWLPGGLAIVCVLASAIFTVLTGGSGVTIVAIGGLLLPVLVEKGYKRDFALGLVTSAGAVGLLLPPSPLVLIYCYVTGVDVKKAYYATLWPGVVLIGLLVAYSLWVGYRQKIPRQKFDPREAARDMWMVKWEMLAPVLVLAGLGTALMELPEAAAAAALYTLIVEVYVYKDLTWRQVLRVARDAMSLAGAIIAILAMATALTNYVIQAELPKDILEFFVARGMTEKWQFIVVLNVYLFIMGMLLDAFSVLLVSLPLVVPLAASFNLHPFYLAVIFLLNLELAYITPPVGLNLFVSAFRFKRPVTEVYRTVLPFVAILAAGLLLIIFWPRLSSFTVEDEVAHLRADAEARGVPPTEAWGLECIQQDRNNLMPCSPEDVARYGADGKKTLLAAGDEDPDLDGGGDDEDDLEAEFDDEEEDEDDLEKEFDDEGNGDEEKDAGADDEDEDLDDL